METGERWKAAMNALGWHESCQQLNVAHAASVQPR